MSVLCHTVTKFKLFTTFSLAVHYRCIYFACFIFQDMCVAIIAKFKHNEIIILPLWSSASGFDTHYFEVNFSNFESHSRHRFLL